MEKRLLASLAFCNLLLFFVGTQAANEFLAVSLEESWWSDEDNGVMVYPGSITELSIYQASGSFPKYHMLNFNATIGIVNTVAALEVDTFTNTVWFTDKNTRSLYSFQMDTTWTDKAPVPVKHIDGFQQLSLGLSFDWITKTVYWADTYHGTIMARPSMSNDPNMMSTVMSGLAFPMALTIDPLVGYMFYFTENPPAIHRATLNGEDPANVIASVGYVFDMAVDVTEQRIYWVDSIHHHIASSTYFGGSERLIYKENAGHLYSAIAVSTDHVCAVAITGGDVICISKTSGKATFEDSFFFEVPFALAIGDNAMQRTDSSDACKDNKCEHMCLIKSASEGVCACQDGYTLVGGVNCTANTPLYDKGILLTNGTNICMFEARALSGSSVEMKCIADNIENATHLAADAKLRLIFFYDTYKKAIMSHNIQTKAFQTLVSNRLTVKDMTYDYMTKDLFWTEEEEIGVVNVLRPSSMRIPLQDASVFKPKASSITSAPLKGQLFWLNGDKTSGKYEIYRSYMDGSQVEIFVTADKLTDPTVLEYEEFSEVLVWFDIDGTKFRRLNNTDVGRLATVIHFGGQDLVLYKRFAVWIDTVGTVNAVNYLDSSLIKIADKASFGKTLGMCIFDSTHEIDREGPCDIANGGCEQICLSTGTKPSCKCKMGFALNAQNKKTCDRNVLTNNFLITVDSTARAVYQVPMDGQSITRLDFPDTIKSIGGAEYNHVDQSLYIADWGGKMIWKTYLDGKNATVVAQLDSPPLRMAIDYTSGYVYYSVGPSKLVIRVVDPSKLVHKTLMEGFKEVWGIAIHPSLGYLFAATGSGIIRANMDGTDRKDIVPTGTLSPDGLTIDYKENMIYWADYLLHTIKMADLNGQNVKQVLYKPGGNLADAYIMGSMLYYVGENFDQIEKWDLKAGKRVPWMNANRFIQTLQTVSAVPGEAQPVSDACKQNNGGCSNFCLPTPNGGRTCGCEDGDVLLEDKLSCKKAKSVCPKILTNGEIQFSDTCYGIQGYKCSYKCNVGHQKQNASHHVLECLSTGKWSHPVDSLCELTKCTDKIPHGEILKGCDFLVNSYCSYKCTDGYHRNQNQMIGCTSAGTWNVDTSLLCEKAVTCTETIKYGQLVQPCNNFNDGRCTVTCNTHTVKNPAIRSIHCRSTGELTVDPDHVCIPTMCSSKFDRLDMDRTCDYKPGVSCGFKCKNGFIDDSSTKSVTCLSSGSWAKTEAELCKPVPCTEVVPRAVLDPGGMTPEAGKVFDYHCTGTAEKSKVIYQVACLPTGQWNVKVNDLCVVPTKSVDPQKQTGDDGLSTGGVIGVTAAVVLVVIILVVCVAGYVISQRSHKTPLMETPVKYSPREFNNPTLEIRDEAVSNPYSELSGSKRSENVYDNSANGAMKPSEEMTSQYHKF